MGSKWLVKQRKREEDAVRLQAQMVRPEQVAPPAPVEPVVLPPEPLFAPAEAVNPELTSQFKPAKYKAGDAYIWKQGDSLFAIARDMEVPVDKLKDYNEIGDPADIQPGDLISYPALEVLPILPVTYELLPRPQPMHLNRPAKKYAFGNAKTWDDIGVTGPTYAEGANVNVEMVAKVPLTDEQGGEITATFLMDRLAVGDYARTGRVTWPIGFNHTHLDEGHVEKVKPEPKPEVTQRISQIEEAKRAMDVTVDMDNTISPNEYKTTLAPLRADRSPIAYVADCDIMVHEMDGRRPSRMLYRNNSVNIACTFEKDGVKYGRPDKTLYWYGIPMDLLTPEDDVMSYDMDLATRCATGKGAPLKPFEKYVVVPIAKVLNSPLIKKMQTRSKK